MLESLGLDEKISLKHPFPGPGLAIRIPGKISPDKVKILQEADFIYVNELKVRIYTIKFGKLMLLCCLLRQLVLWGTVEHMSTRLLRAVKSEDGMTAQNFNLPRDFLNEISNKIINKVRGINRVVYDITSKPPSTIELE